MTNELLCFGHRGAMGHAPENTLISVERALALGVDWIEVDVHRVDGRLVVFHDDRLERTTNGSGYLAEHSFEYLRSLDAGEGQRVPTLEEVFDTVAGRCGLNVELKGPGTAEPVVRLVEERLRSGWRIEQILISSFNHRELRRVRELSPALRIGALLVGLPVDDAAFAAALGCYSAHLSVEFIDQAFVADAHRRGLKVFVFTTDDPRDIARMREIGVDGVFTNYPDRVQPGSSFGI
jgi:glycerophosphoryl diester phosphodiesterase